MIERMLRYLSAIVLFAMSPLFAQNSIPGSSGGGAPSGPCNTGGGDLAGNYSACTLNSAITTSVTWSGNHIFTKALTGSSFSDGATSANWILDSTFGIAGFTPAAGNTTMSLALFPSGTGITARMSVYNSSSTTNYARMSFEIVGSTSAGIVISKLGTGTIPSVLNIGSNNTDTTGSLTSDCLQFNGICRGTLSNVGNWKVASEQVTSLTTGVGHYDSSGNLTSSPVVAADMSGPLNANGGTTVIYRCTVAGTLRVGQLTSVSADCGTAVDTGLRTN